MRKWRTWLILAAVSFFLFNCSPPLVETPYDIQGTVKLSSGTPLEEVTITAGTKTATSDPNGNWTISGLTGSVTVRAQKKDYYIVVAGTVNPSKSVSSASTIDFTAYAENEEFAGGSGTATDPWIIVNVRQLDEVRHYISDSTPRYYKQIRDLDLNDLKSKVSTSEANWEPIGSETIPFHGSYNGMGFSIKNMVVLTSTGSTEKTSGLFGYVNEATITNLVLENAQVDCPDASDAGILAGRIDYSFVDNVGIVNSRVSQGSYIGGLVGFTEFSTFTNCSVQAIVNSPQDNPSFSVGGFVGEANTSRFENCRVEASKITGKSEKLGGFTGESDTNIFQNCHFEGTIENATATYVGGFVGWAEQDENLAEYAFESCSVSGSLSAQRDTLVMTMLRIGGFAGYIADSNRISFVNCVVGADIEIPQNGFTAGGFFGEALTLHRFYQCGFEGSITGDNEESPTIGGFGGFAENTSGINDEMTIEQCYTKFSIAQNLLGAEMAGFLTMTHGDRVAIKDCYAKGTIPGVRVGTTTQSAGFVWMNTTDSVPDIKYSYAAVAVTDYGFVFNFSSDTPLQVTDCFWDTDLAQTSSDESTAQGKTTSQMKNQSTYTNWDFTDVWKINASKNDGYPYLSWEDEL
ncbi:carboxypeptidase-like regulatory domain-containing protein [Pseudothermotoga sp. U03pept]|uniref:carboxypeptidase-like regulatory domain-containing protein n=1 Tax=Pseudothermotoga sp. U03pept TaxID=3447012 RepID=UPI003F00B61F